MTETAAARVRVTWDARCAESAQPHAFAFVLFMILCCASCAIRLRIMQLYICIKSYAYSDYVTAPCSVCTSTDTLYSVYPPYTAYTAYCTLLLLLVLAAGLRPDDALPNLG